MKNYLRPLVIVLAISLIFSSVVLRASAQTGNIGGIATSGEQQAEGSSINVVPGGPGFIMVHPAAFFPETTSGQRAFGMGGILYNPGVGSEFYITAVDLPHGAMINKIVLYYKDSTIETLEVVLARFGHEEGVTVMARVESVGSNVSPQIGEETTILANAVDNQRYGYFMELFLPGGFGSNMHIRGVRIDYSYPVNLPLINK